MTGKLLLKLDTVKFIAANHSIISALNYILKKKKKTFSTFYLTVHEMNLYTYCSHSFLTFLISGGAVPFLEEYRCSPSRTTFHYTIGWIIFMEDSPWNLSHQWIHFCKYSPLSLSLYIYIYKYVYFAHIQHVSLTGFCPDSVYGNYTSKLDPVNFGTQWIPLCLNS